MVSEERVNKFETLAYGMFIHYGLYSQLGRGEWVMDRESIPFSEYSKLADIFTASDFDGKEIAKIAKKSGMKYICLTTRHHDGFSLYDTKGLNDFDAIHSAAGRDLIKDFVDGCRYEDIVPFFYHTTIDWSLDIYKNDFESYLDYLNSSIEILCRNYGQVGGFWFDGNWDKPEADWKEDYLYNIIRKYQPEAIIVNNTGLNARGKIGHTEIDVVTYERGRPKAMNRNDMPKYLAGEMCLTMNQHWGIGKNDFNYLSPKELIEGLCACRKVGANLLLNVGPTSEGAMPDYERATLLRVGQWCDQYSDILSNGKPCGVKVSSNKDFVLNFNNSYYIFVHDLPIDGDENVTLGKSQKTSLVLYNLKDKVSGLHWIDNGQELVFQQNLEDNSIEIFPSGFQYGTDLVVRVAEIFIA